MMNTIREAYGSVVSRIGSPTKTDYFNHKKVLCVGLCNLDIVQVVNTFPEEDSDQRCLESRWQRGGNASNNCTVLSQLGVECEYLGTLSKENHLNFLLEDFNKYNISMEHCVYYNDCEAPLSTVIIGLENASRTILHSNPNLHELKFDEFKRISLKNYKWIHFEGRNVSEVLLMMEYVEHWNTTNSKDESFVPIKISVDLEKKKPELLDLLPYADVVFVGKDFAKARHCTNMSETLKSIVKDTKPDAQIICAWGDRGAMGRDSDGTIVQSPAFPPRKILDTLGAGDTFCATVIYGLCRGESLQNSLYLGCRIAGAKVGMKGFSGIQKVFEKMARAPKTPTSNT